MSISISRVRKPDAALVRYVEAEIIPRYASFDKAHQVSHVQTVISQSLVLAAYYPELNVDMVYVIAAYHDTGLVEGREFHHIASGRILLADQTLRKWFSEADLQVMKEAVEDHRASSDHEPRSLYGRIVAEADRQIEVDVVLRRTVQYGLKHTPELDKEGHYQRMCEHLHEKYAEGGYLKLWIPQSQNATELERLRQVIRDEEQLRAAFERIYQEET